MNWWCTEVQQTQIAPTGHACNSLTACQVEYDSRQYLINFPQPHLRTLPVISADNIRNICPHFTRSNVRKSAHLHGKERTETKNFFTFHASKYNTRSHCYKLETKRSRLELRRNFFSQRVVVPWNKLPESVVTAESVNAFKNRLDKEWGNQSSRWTPCPTSTSILSKSYKYK